MKNVICDICGTSYPAAAAKCPICGSSREYALENAEDVSEGLDFLEEEEEVRSAPKKKNREIFDFDEVNQVKPARRKVEEVDDEEEEEEEEYVRTNVGLVIVLVVLIVLLLLAAGFFFLKYLRPAMTTEQTQPPVTTAAAQTEAVETTDPGKPCTNLMMDGGKMELGKDGKKLLNVRVYPEDTTDALTFVSGDESIVTVSEDGTVTAVGEGQTVITVNCGQQQIACNVTVDYTIGLETVPTEEIPAMQVENEDGAASGDSTAATGETVATETTQATEATVETTAAETKLKLKKTDITIGFRGASIPIELEGDLDPKDVKWASTYGDVAFVNSEGCIISTGSGITRIVGEYNGETVEMIVRCVF